MGQPPAFASTRLRPPLADHNVLKLKASQKAHAAKNHLNRRERNHGRQYEHAIVRRLEVTTSLSLRAAD